LQARTFWSIKHAAYVLKYQVVVSIKVPKIILFSDAYAGAVHDMHIARDSGLDQLLLQNREVCIGDKAYAGSLQFVTPYKVYRNRPLTDHQREHNRRIEKYRNFVERMNQRLKIWHVNQDVWRHPVEKHCLVFQVTAMLTNFDLTKHPLLRDDF